MDGMDTHKLRVDGHGLVDAIDRPMDRMIDDGIHINRWSGRAAGRSTSIRRGSRGKGKGKQGSSRRPLLQGRSGPGP